MRTSVAWISCVLALGLVVGACGGTIVDHSADGSVPEGGGPEGGVVCGATTCQAGDQCCSDCSGAQFCGPACPGYFCPPDGGGPPDAPPADSPPDSTGDGPDGGGCRTNADCSMVGYCATPEDPPCSGVCIMQTKCTTDTECSGGKVCRQGSHIQNCGGDTTGSFCLPPCAGDTDCRGYEQCSSGHCVPRSCSTCPSYLSCTSGSCAPVSCKSDSECPGGYCVDGGCYGSLGTCMGLCA